LHVPAIMTRAQLIAALQGAEGWLGDDEAWTLHRAVASCPDPGPVKVVEIGSWKGRSTIALASAIVTRSASGIVLAVDPHRGGVAHRMLGEEDTFDRFLANLERAGVSRVVQPIRANSEAARGQVPDHSVHVLFVDGSHRYEDVLNDIDTWESALCPAARVAFHDAISSPGVAAALRERALALGSNFRRPRLVEETMLVDYRPAEPWRLADSGRALSMRMRLACVQAARLTKARLRRPTAGGRPS
jgi:predicted O-methyltransferase YrrM